MWRPVRCLGSAAGERRRHCGTVFSIRGRVQPELSRQLLRRAPRAWQDSSLSSSLVLRQLAHCCLGGRVSELSWLGRSANNCEVGGAPDPSTQVPAGTLFAAGAIEMVGP